MQGLSWKKVLLCREKEHIYGVETPVGGTYRPRVPGAGWGQGTQSICICHFVYCFYLQEELKQKLNGVFLSPLNMNHSSKTNLTIEISKVRGSSNNPRAKAGGRGGCSRHRTYAQRCGSPARDRLPGRQAQDPFMRMPSPNIGKCFNPNLRLKRKKKKNPKHTNPTNHPAITTILNRS